MIFKHLSKRTDEHFHKKTFSCKISISQISTRDLDSIRPSMKFLKTDRKSCNSTITQSEQFASENTYLDAPACPGTSLRKL